MTQLYQECPECENHLFYDRQVPAIIADDPQLTFFLRNTSFSLLSQEVGKIENPAREHVFISYSHKDSKWLHRLQTILKPLVRKGTLTTWADTQIHAGSKWKDEIEVALAAAKVVVLLVSPNFLESDFIADHELPPLLEAAEKQGLVILWVCVSTCLYEETEIKDYQAAHDISKPLDILTPAQQNAVLANVCRKIKSAATFSREWL